MLNITSSVFIGDINVTILIDGSSLRTEASYRESAAETEGDGSEIVGKGSSSAKEVARWFSGHTWDFNLSDPRMVRESLPLDPINHSEEAPFFFVAGGAFNISIWTPDCWRKVAAPAPFFFVFPEIPAADKNGAISHWPENSTDLLGVFEPSDAERITETAEVKLTAAKDLIREWPIKFGFYLTIKS
jgi:hypothetical protein